MTHHDRDEDRRIEQEIRAQRQSSLADALAGQDNGSHLKGASPTPVLKRALLEIDQWLSRCLRDNEGSLMAVILRRLRQRPEQLEAGLGTPAVTVAAWLDMVLAHDSILEDLVREVDMDWGQRNQERPFFERPGQEPHPDDPYTKAGVRQQLADLRGRC